jgi:glycosyltransferase involved in cell wall biosynthesis
MLTTSFPRWPGDLSGNFVESLARSLTARGVEIQVVAPGHVLAPGREKRSGIAIKRFKYAFPSRAQIVAYEGGIPHKLRTSNLARLELAPFSLSMLGAAYRAAAQCDIIHAHWIPTGVFAALVSKTLDIPVVLTVHGSDGTLLRAGGLGRVISRFSLDNAGRIITVSDALKNRVLEFEPGLRTVSTIRNGVDLEQFPFVEEVPDKRRLLWVGRMTEEKGVEFLIRAMKKVVARHGDAELRLVGGGPLRLRMETLAAELGLLDSMEFVGERRRSELPQMYAWCDSVVMPSLSEGLPMVLLEAMAVGRPVIASAVGGIPEILRDGETGILVSPGNVDELAQRIIGLLGNPGLARKMGAAARRLVEATSSWDVIASQVFSVYDSLSRK